MEVVGKRECVPPTPPTPPPLGEGTRDTVTPAVPLEDTLEERETREVVVKEGMAEGELEREGVRVGEEEVDPPPPADTEGDRVTEGEDEIEEPRASEGDPDPVLTLSAVTLEVSEGVNEEESVQELEPLPPPPAPSPAVPLGETVAPPDPVKEVPPEGVPLLVPLGDTLTLRTPDTVTDRVEEVEVEKDREEVAERVPAPGVGVRVTALGEALPLLLLPPLALWVVVKDTLPESVKDRETVRVEEVLGLWVADAGGEGVTDALGDFSTDRLLTGEKDTEGHLEDVRDTLWVAERVRLAVVHAEREGVRVPVAEPVTLLGLALPPPIMVPLGERVGLMDTETQVEEEGVPPLPTSPLEVRDGE